MLRLRRASTAARPAPVMLTTTTRPSAGSPPRVANPSRSSRVISCVIAGWETQIARDFDTGKHLGYCALANKGYSAKNLPIDLDEARVIIVKEFIDFWAKSLIDAGVPNEKIFSHTTFFSKTAYDFAKSTQPEHLSGTYLEMVNFSPSHASFGAHYYSGFTTYPQFGLLEEIQAERAKNGNQPWASSEGTAIDPAMAEKGGAGISMETYLGNLFNRGAALVNIFGWGVGDSSNPFRKVAENENAIRAYQKFFRGEPLAEERENTQIPSPQFFSKLQKLQKELPLYLAQHGSGKVGTLYTALNQQLDAKRFIEAEKSMDELFKIIE